MQGTCTSVSNCAEVKKAILSGRRDHTSCGFQGFTEIVCCPGPISQTTKQTTVKPSSRDRVSVRSKYLYYKNIAFLVLLNEFCL